MTITLRKIIATSYTIDLDDSQLCVLKILTDISFDWYVKYCKDKTLSYILFLDILFRFQKQLLNQNYLIFNIKYISE